jgi:lipoate-protein ligase A
MNVKHIFYFVSAAVGVVARGGNEIEINSQKFVGNSVNGRRSILFQHMFLFFGCAFP